VKFELRVLSEGEQAEAEANHERWLALREVEADEHDQKVQLCAWARGGHRWLLEIDPAGGKDLSCAHCPAGMDDLCPDGFDVAAGDFEVYPGYVLTIQSGYVLLNNEDYDERHAYGWRGPVSAQVETTRYPGGPWGPEEWDVCVILEAL
jgi:hypothetical protein